MKKDYNEIGKLCREYRMIHLQATLKEIEGSDNIKALSSFEHGRSTNVEHFTKYLRYCKTTEERVKFMTWFIKKMEG